MFVIDLSSHKIQSCACINVSIQGNLQTESSKCSKWGKEKIVIDLSSHKLQSCACTNVSIQGQLTR